MPHNTAQDLINDVLFRAGESQSPGASLYRGKALDYLNKVYRALCAGASEFLPESVEDWWWLRESGILTLLPITTLGSVNVAQDNINVTFTDAPAPSVVGYFIRFENHPEVFRIATHTALSTAATLDSPYTGPTVSSNAYKLMKCVYNLDSAVAALQSPMIGYRGNCRITGVTPEGMDAHFPIPELQPGIPTMFALETEQQVRFNMGGRIDGFSMRVEYRYRPVVAALTDSPSSVPLVPIEYRALLSDMATAYIYRDKNDQRDQSSALSARAGLAAMYKENKRRLKRMDTNLGHIYPRQGGQYGHPGRNSMGPLRTEAGLIIG